MSQPVIYNEGRVQGYNAYEIYVRQLLAEFPDIEVPSEKEWLSSILSNGLSMILKVKGGTLPGYHDYPLPADSKLCAATIISATVFDGKCTMDSRDTWAVNVTDYGMLSSNTQHVHPITPGDSSDTYPIQIGYDYYDTERALKEYIKITEGIVYQPGEWIYPEGTKTEYTDSAGNAVIEYPDRKPFMDYKPDLTKSAVIRLKVEAQLSADVYILLTGFLDKTSLRPVFSTDTGVINTPAPQDGDFLGPAVFPWCTKITFNISNEMLYMIQRPPVVKQIASESNQKSISSQPIVDMDTIDPVSFYTDKYEDSTLPLDVSYCSSTGDSVSYLAVYQREDIDSHGLSGRHFPPVMYATKVQVEGQHKLVPIDIASPGTVKVFNDKTLASAYPNVLPNVFAIYKDDEGHLFFVDTTDNKNEVNMIDLSSKVSVENVGTLADPIYQAVITSGKNTVKVPAITDEDGKELKCIQFNKDVEFRGDVKQHGVTLTENDYITFGNGLRLYVSNVEPENDGNIPIGSIGIGW